MNMNSSHIEKDSSKDQRTMGSKLQLQIKQGRTLTALTNRLLVNVNISLRFPTMVRIRTNYAHHATFSVYASSIYALTSTP